ncbi:MAG: response regulator transcription factor [bacterium]
MGTKQVTVAVVEDNNALRANLVAMLKEEPKLQCVGAFPDAEQALLKLPELKPAVVLMDIKLPGMSGVECVSKLTLVLPETHVIMITVYDDSDSIFESLAAGAAGYLLKPVRPAQLVEAIEEVRAGGAPMSMSIARRVVQTFKKPAPAAGNDAQLWPREVEILSLLSKGLLKKEIGDQLGISYWTVQTHVGRIYKKLQVHSRAQAVAKYRNL